MNTTISRCNQCILPSNYPEIEFIAGTCNYCGYWKKKWGHEDLIAKEGNLERILSAYRGKTKPYDCVIGISGGKDSSYVAYLAKKYGMNPIAVTFNNTFLTETGRENIVNITNTLEIPHVFVEPDIVFIKNLYRHFLVTVGEFCSVCNIGIAASVYRVANEFGIRLVLSGHSPRTEANSPQGFFTSACNYFKNVAKERFSPREIDDFVYMWYKERVLRHFTKNPTFLKFAHYLPWKEERMLQELSTDVGFMSSLWEQHQDCSMSHVKEYLKLSHFGVTERTAKLSSLIRDGQITREKALDISAEYEQKLRQNENMYKELICNTFKINDRELNQALKASHISYIPRIQNVIGIIKRKYLRP